MLPQQNIAFPITYVYLGCLYQIVGNYIFAGPGSANSFQTCLREPSWAAQSRVFFIFCKGCLERNKYIGNTKLQLNSTSVVPASFVWKK